MTLNASPAAPTDYPLAQPAYLALFLFGAAVIVRVVCLSQYLDSPLPNHPGVDPSYYTAWARRIVAGQWLGPGVFEQSPLYAYLLAGSYALFGERALPMLLAQTLAGAVSAVLVYACGRRLLSPVAAWLAGLGYGFYGPAVFYELQLNKTFLEPLLVLWFLYGALRYRETRRLAWLFLAGVALGLAALVRENHLLLLPVLSVWLWLLETGRARLRWLIPLLAVSLCLAPALLHNRLSGGEWVLVTAAGGEAFYMGQAPGADGYYRPPDFMLARAGNEHADFRDQARRHTGQALTPGEVSAYWFDQGWKAVIADPSRILGLLMTKGLILLKDFEVPDNASYRVAREEIPLLAHLPSFGWIAALGMLGLVLALGEPRRWLPVLGVVAAYLAVLLVFYHFGRFRLGLAPVWWLLAAHGLGWLAATQRRLRAGVVVVGVAALTAWSFLPREPVRYTISDLEVRAALALDRHQPEAAIALLSEALELRHPAVGPANATRQYQRARAHQQLARALCMAGRYGEAAWQFRAVRDVALRPGVVRELLRYQLVVLQRGDCAPGLAQPALKAERSATLNTLGELIP